jgi:hypothetical protein
MSRFNKKGFKSIKGTDRKSGKIVTVAVPIGGKTDSDQQRLIKQAEKQRLQQNREYKKKLAELKKSVPLEERSKINWTEKMREIANA